MSDPDDEVEHVDEGEYYDAYDEEVAKPVYLAGGPRPGSTEGTAGTGFYAMMNRVLSGFDEPDPGPKRRGPHVFNEKAPSRTRKPRKKK